MALTLETHAADSGGQAPLGAGTWEKLIDGLVFNLLRGGRTHDAARVNYPQCCPIATFDSVTDSFK
jgi:hypothetical protein